MLVANGWNTNENKLLEEPVLFARRTRHSQARLPDRTTTVMLRHMHYVLIFTPLSQKMNERFRKY